MQMALLDTDQTGQFRLTHIAFDTLIHHSDSFCFLLDAHLCIRTINQKACHFFAMDSKKIIKQHLPSWFIENGLVPPLVHIESAKNEYLEKGFQTKVIKSDQAYFIDWDYQFLSDNLSTQGLLLRGSIHSPGTYGVTSASLGQLRQKPSIFDAIYQHTNQLTLLANQTLQNQQLDSMGLKIAIQAMLQSIDKSQQLLSFASSLEKCKYTQANTGNSVVLQKVLQSIIEKYQSEHASFNVQILLESHQAPLSVKQFCDNEQIHQGLTALFSPLLCFLHKGSIKISFFQKITDSKIGLNHIQCKIQGEDLFGDSIHDWFGLRHETIQRHQTLYLHWVLGKEWLNHFHGLYQIRLIGTEAHIDMMLPFEMEDPVLVSQASQHPIPDKKAEKKPRSAVTFDYKNDKDPVTQELRNAESIAILLVEDNEINRRAVLQIVHRIYGNVYFKVASCAEEALAAFEQAHYDLILMDIGLPDNQGLQLAYGLRQIEAQLERQATPICILSAHYTKEMYEEECETVLKDTLIQAFYAKPLLPLKAQELIDYWVPQAILRRYEVHA
jgi:CheY-like chemotaxis protein